MPKQCITEQLEVERVSDGDKGSSLYLQPRV